MKHIKTLSKDIFNKNHQTDCKECQSSCQSACKTSCTVGNQNCARDEKVNRIEKDKQI